MKNEKGITLMALIITIVLLLIIASITISSITSGDGILKHADNEHNKVQTEVNNLKDKINSLYIEK